MDKSVRSVILFIILVVIPGSYRLFAQSKQISVGGNTVYCTYPNGQSVLWYSSPTLNDVGYTTPQGIYFNPIVLGPMSVALQLFWLGHECGHAHLQTSDESKADCWSAKTGVAQGWFDADDAIELAKEMQNNPGDNSHPPGPVRARNIAACMGQSSSDSSSGSVSDRGTPDRARGLVYHGPIYSPPVPKDPTKRNRDPKTMCKSLNDLVASATRAFDNIEGGDRTPHSAFTTLQLPVAKECFIEKTSHPVYKCNFQKDYYDTVVSQVSACFPSARKSGDKELTTFHLTSPLAGYFTISRDEDTSVQIRSTK